MLSCDMNATERIADCSARAIRLKITHTHTHTHTHTLYVRLWRQVLPTIYRHDRIHSVFSALMQCSFKCTFYFGNAIDGLPRRSRASDGVANSIRQINALIHTYLLLFLIVNINIIYLFIFIFIFISCRSKFNSKINK